MVKIPGTPAPQDQEVPVPMPQMQPPLEIVVHAAQMGVRKVPTPDGTLTLLQLMSPTGIMFSLKFDDDGVDHLVRQLKGMDIVTASQIVVP